MEKLLLKCGIYLSRNKFTKEFIPTKRIRNNKEVKLKLMNGKIKRLIRETKIAFQIQKINNKIKQERGN